MCVSVSLFSFFFFTTKTVSFDHFIDAFYYCSKLVDFYRTISLLANANTQRHYMLKRPLTHTWGAYRTRTIIKHTKQFTGVSTHFSSLDEVEEKDFTSV